MKEAYEIKNFLEYPKNYVSLKLSYITDKEFQSLVKELEVNNTLTSLDLSNAPIGDKGVYLLAKILEVNNTLTELNLVNNGISDEGAIYLAKMLDVNNTLTNIVLRNIFWEQYLMSGYCNYDDVEFNKINDTEVLNKIKDRTSENKTKLIDYVCKFFEKEILILPSKIIHTIVLYLELTDLALLRRDLSQQEKQKFAEDVGILGITESANISNDLDII